MLNIDSLCLCRVSNTLPVPSDDPSKEADKDMNVAITPISDALRSSDYRNKMSSILDAWTAEQWLTLGRVALSSAWLSAETLASRNLWLAAATGGLGTFVALLARRQEIRAAKKVDEDE